ncbi:hypothetical protein OUZ56_003545 [Daphnia magna]|uniref:Uncharacterized protein n=1 Tax=Daphnia magna TaxID=35525 RepID=A0ABR0A914_9CRUS|nr:hypothetical protein OUZ56_003545 [Daphnia magna]
MERPKLHTLHFADCSVSSVDHLIAIGEPAPPVFNILNPNCLLVTSGPFPIKTRHQLLFRFLFSENLNVRELHADSDKISGTGKTTDRRPDPTAAWRQETRKGDSSSAAKGRARQLLGGTRRYGQYKSLKDYMEILEKGEFPQQGDALEFLNEKSAST